MADPEAVLRIAAALVEGRLHPAAAERVEAALEYADAIQAVAELAELLDDGSRAVWSLAGEIEHRAKRYEGTVYGRRPPRNAVEARLERIVRSPTCPRSRRRLVDILS